MTGAVNPASTDECLDALLRRCGERIVAGRGCERAEALFEVRLLAGFVTGLDTTALMLQGDRPLEPGSHHRLESLCERRAAGEPVAYLIGERGFWRYRFHAAPGVLIPRPDTELLVECALELLPGTTRSRVLDLGTGSGAIALSIAAERPAADVHAVDRSEVAIRLAARNREFLAEQGASVKVGLWQGNWLDAVAPGSVDLIVSNPPYIAAGDPHLTAGDLRHEPIEALVADEAGLADYRRIIAQARTVLRPGGWLLLEHGFEQAQAVGGLLDQAGFETIDTRRDVAGHPRVTAGRRPG
ncbi:peptide chain release factor N(5)-glutamine methyltransferase [Guyparkeria halophila]|uniref:Release factor glutamine methyltransferase n=1 Tax=Guyparkeria halophila TaxID=47960 RepID=A0ABZ0YTQ3_9GAMM|nr:peptide chain release factor N(5)-glutamine methyltransferase [Guyparkeria halophila]WQH15537.1 peptide chain release factor N(5)-glutamine methyltransferase [Guyparkeria halophila]